MSQQDKPAVVLDRPVQIGIVVRNIEETTAVLGSLFGIGPFRVTEWPVDRPDMRFEYQGKPEQMKMRLAFAQVGPLEIELIQPLEGDSDYARFLATKGGGLHHILFDVPDMESTLTAMADRGIGVLMTGTGLRPGSRWVHLATDELLPFRIELRNRVAGSDGTSPVPPAPGREG